MATYTMTLADSGKYETTFKTSSDHDVLQVSVPENGRILICTRASSSSEWVVLGGFTATAAQSKIWLLDVPTGMRIKAVATFSATIDLLIGT